MLLRILLGHRKESVDQAKLATGIDYIRVLGFTERGQRLLHDMRAKAKVPIVTSAAKESSPFLALDAQATAVYSLAFRNPDASAAYRDYTKPPIRI
jgi:4-hydroxyphenylpyruvate dioxygenase-like putative hemolysin